MTRLFSINKTFKHSKFRAWIAEFFGTFNLVFIGCGSGIAMHVFLWDYNHIVVSLVTGTVVMCMVYWLGRISGAHINPAVTIGLTLSGHAPWRQMLPYLLAQCLGAVTASIAHNLTFGASIAGKAGYAATAPNNIPLISAFLIEFFLTFLLMSMIMFVVIFKKRLTHLSGVFIGLAVTLGILIGGNLTGGSMNPARSFGPSIVSGGPNLHVLWLYVSAPIAGAVFSAMTITWIFKIIHQKRTVIQS